MAAADRCGWTFPWTCKPPCWMNPACKASRPKTPICPLLLPESIRHELEKAVYIATHGRRGPVWLDIPLDVQATMLDESSLQGFTPEDADLPAAPSELREQVTAAIHLLNQSQRPVLFLGSGVRSAAASGLVDQLVDEIGRAHV